jgi:hypothetical protein
MLLLLTPRRPTALILNAIVMLMFAVSFASTTSAATENLTKHPLSIVKGDIYVGRTGTTMRLICFAEDLEMLQGVEAFEDGLYDPAEIKDATQDHAKYLAEKITIRDVAGKLLKPEITEIVDVEIPEGGIESGKLMEYTMEFVLEFDYETPPEFVTIQQDMIAEGALLPSEFHVLLKQAGSDTPYAKTLKPQTPETFRFDWDNPVLNEGDSEEEWKQWFETQREKTLGITSYGSVYSFIYITDHEVRHEVLIPLATLASLMELERQDESFLDIDEQTAAAKKVEAFFGAGNPVTIDGIEVKPVFDRIDFYGLDIRDFAVRPEKRKVSMASGRVGVIMSYSAKTRPAEVTVEWDLLSSTIREVDSAVIAYNEVSKTKFSKFLTENIYRWQAPDRPPLPPITSLGDDIQLTKFEQPMLKISWVAVGLITAAVFVALFGLAAASTQWPFWLLAVVLAAGAWLGAGAGTAEYPDPFREAELFQMQPENAEDIFGRLHANMFRAFDYRDEGDVYDALAKSVDRDLLRELYLQINQGLKIKEQGGAVAVIEEVRLLDGETSPIRSAFTPKSPVSFGYSCSWSLRGTIEHWGHIHERENKYQAKFVVEYIDEAGAEIGWKITDMSDQEFEPGKVKQRVRRF